MTPDERDLRRALEARSGELSPQFRVRLTAALDEGRPASNLMQAVAMVAVIALTLGTVGALLLSRNARNVAHQGPVSGSRLASPTASPIAMPTTAQLSAPSGSVVWAFVGGGSLFRSTNRGDTWEPRSLPPTKAAGFQEISFIDAQQGWYLTGPAYQTECRGAETQIWHTNDGAATWQKVAVGMWTLSYKSDNVGGDQCREKLSFIDPMHGFVAGWATGRHPTIYRTLDGGKNWAGADLPDPQDFQTGPGFSLRAGSVRRLGTTLYVIGWGKQPGTIPDRQYMFRSTDGGATWSWMTKIPSPYVVMVTESRWLQLVVPGQSMESTTSGQQWHPYPSDFNTDTPVGGPQIVFADSQVGYAEGRGALQRTVDGGSHWTRIDTPGIASLNPTPAPTSSPVALLPVTDPGFQCRLPVGTGSFGSKSSGGFVTIPSGSLQLDPAASMVKGQQWTETTAQPVLRGNSGVVTYDAPFARWLPTSSDAVSSDGSQYAWVEGPWPGKVVHVTKVADGSDRSFAAGPPNDPDLQNHGPVSPAPIGVTKDSVFLTYGYEGAWGIWRLDIVNGSLTKVRVLPSPNYGAGAIWVTPTRGPNHVGMYSDGDTLARLDLSSGALVDWFHRDNLAVRYLGVDDAGNPWVEAISRQTAQWVIEVWRLRGPGQADLILSGQRAMNVVSDSHGTWFGNDTGIYLYASGRVQRVSPAAIGEVVGPCL